MTEDCVSLNSAMAKTPLVSVSQKALGLRKKMGIRQVATCDAHGFVYFANWITDIV